jgi:hypothetical protein
MHADSSLLQASVLFWFERPFVLSPMCCDEAVRVITYDAALKMFDG